MGCDSEDLYFHLLSDIILFKAVNLPKFFNLVSDELFFLLDQYFSKIL